MLPYPQIDPVALQLGPIAVRWYGLMYVAGFVTAWLLGRWRASRSTGTDPRGQWTPADVDDLMTYCIVGLLLGARVGYILFYDLAATLADPMEILRVWRGGMSFHGGALGLAAAFALFARVKGKRFFAVTDFTVPLAAPGLFFGRLGNFINAELWGKPSDVPWAMVFPGGGPLPRHPSQLYEALLEGVVLFIMVWWFSKRPRPLGAVSGLFLLGYGVFRFSVEFVREPDAHIGYLAWDWLTMGQLLSAPMALCGAGFLAWAYLRR